MLSLFADDNFPMPAVRALRALGHDVLTMVEAGLSNKRIPDEIVLDYSTRLGRAVLTCNWEDFVDLHDSGKEHTGMIVCEVDSDAVRLAHVIDASLRGRHSLFGQLVEVGR